MGKKISADELGATIAASLLAYSEEVTDKVKKEAKSAADELTRDIRDDANKSVGGSGKYAKGWKNKKSFENTFDIRYTVFNKTDYQLTHLLEYGHVKWLWGRRTDGRVDGKTHIREISERAIRKFEEAVDRVIGGK